MLTDDVEQNESDRKVPIVMAKAPIDLVAMERAARYQAVHRAGTTKMDRQPAREKLALIERVRVLEEAARAAIACLDCRALSSHRTDQATAILREALRPRVSG